MIRFAPAGFLYKNWEGVVYPQPRKTGFDHPSFIASCFDTVEINSSGGKRADDEIDGDGGEGARARHTC